MRFREQLLETCCRTETQTDAPAKLIRDYYRALIHRAIQRDSNSNLSGLVEHGGQLKTPARLIAYIVNKNPNIETQNCLDRIVLTNLLRRESFSNTWKMSIE